MNWVTLLKAIGVSRVAFTRRSETEEGKPSENIPGNYFYSPIR